MEVADGVVTTDNHLEGAPHEAAEADPARCLLRSIWGAGDDGDAAPCSLEDENSARSAVDNRLAEDDAETMTNNPQFDWAQYREAFPDATPHAAITAL